MTSSSTHPLPPTRTDQINDALRLTQSVHGLTFGTDAYLLASYVRPAPRSIAVDLGSGTGVIPLLCLGRQKARRFYAVEIQPSFARLIRQNAADNHREADLIPVEGDLRDRSLLRQLIRDGQADVVTANPPYMRRNSGYPNRADEKYIARHEVCGSIEDFCNAAAFLLRTGGRFYCVWRPDRLPDLSVALRQADLEPKRMTLVQATPYARPSLVLLEAIRGAAPSLDATPPLSLWIADNECPSKPRLPLQATADASFIYTHGAFPPAFLSPRAPHHHQRERTTTPHD